MGLLCRLLGHDYGSDDICGRCGTSRGSKGLKFKKTADKGGYVLISARDCTDEVITVPQFYKKKIVKEIGKDAFYGRTEPYRVVLHRDLEHIGPFAFASSALLDVDYRGAHCTLDEFVFDQCERLTHLPLPEGITHIPESAFSGCLALTEVTLPESVVSVGEDAFYDCRALEHFDYDSDTIELCARAFWDCVALESIRLPDGMRELPESLLRGCVSLRELTIPDSVIIIGEYALCDCVGLREITLPEGVASVGSGAFSGCTGIESFTFPTSLTDFVPSEQSKGDIFCGCAGLRELHIHPNFKHFPSGMLKDCTSLTDIYLEGGKSLDWRAIQKDDGWDEGSATYVVHCINGRIRKGC